MDALRFPLRPAVLLLALLPLTVLAAEPLKIATVDAPRAFNEWHLTKLEREKVQEQRDALRADTRLEQIKLTQVELQELEAEVRDASHTEEVRRAYYEKYQMKAHELNSLLRDHRSMFEEENHAISQAMVKRTRELLTTLLATVHEVAEAGGYDLVFDTGGKTSSRIASLVYIRNATDITDQVIAILNREESLQVAAEEVGRDP